MVMQQAAGWGHPLAAVPGPRGWGQLADGSRTHQGGCQGAQHHVGTPTGTTQGHSLAAPAHVTIPTGSAEPHHP